MNPCRQCTSDFKEKSWEHFILSDNANNKALMPVSLAQIQTIITQNVRDHSIYKSVLFTLKKSHSNMKYNA